MCLPVYNKCVCELLKCLLARKYDNISEASSANLTAARVCDGDVPVCVWLCVNSGARACVCVCVVHVARL